MGVVFSYSSFQTFKDCPKKFYLSKIQKVKGIEDRSFTAPGSVVHRAAEYFLKENDDSLFDKEKISSELLATESKDPCIDLKKAYGSFDKANDLAQKSAENLYTFLYGRKEQSEEVLSEVCFGRWNKPLYLDGVPVQGFVDMVEKVGGGKANIYDFKVTFSTKSLRPTQLLLYKMAIEKLFEVKVFTTAFFLLPVKKFEYYTFVKEDCEKLLDSMKRALEDIEANNYVARPGEHCRYCAFKNTEYCDCKAKKVIFEDVGFTPLNSVSL